MKSTFSNRSIWRNIIAVLLTGNLAHAQMTEMQFERISIESGLSQSSILTICQDRKGFLWFGTYEGLNRYDGYHFKVYKNDFENPNSLSKNSIEYVFEDHLGMLWIGTEDGLNRFDREKEQFIRYTNDPHNPNSISNSFARYIYEDRSGTLWIGTQGGGLNRFDREHETFTHYKNIPSDPKSISNNNVLSIIEDNSGRLWVGTDGGLNYFDREKKVFTSYVHDPKNPQSISHNSVWRIYEDHEGNLWLGTWGGGLNLFDIKNNRFIRYQYNPNNPLSLSGDIVRSILEDRRGNLWIGTTNGGLNKIPANSPRDGNIRFIRYQNAANDLSSLSENSVVSLAEDKLGILWIGTNYNGINKYNPNTSQFALYRNRENNSNSLSKNIVTAIYEDSSGIIWIGTGGGGLNSFDIKNNRFTRYLNDPRDPRSISNNAVRSIYEDSRKRLWIGTEYGLNYLDRKSGEFIRYQNDPNNQYSISHNTIWCITEDLKGNLWIGTFGGGVNKFDITKKVFSRYELKTNPSESTVLDIIWTIHRDSAGLLWIGTLADGLNCYNPETGACTRYQFNNDNPLSISDNKVLSLYEDQKGIIWVGTSNGLNKFDRMRGTFHRYSVRDGLPSNSIQGIQQDHHGDLWISTKKGLTRFNTATRTFKNYFESYGLQSNEFTVNACCKTKNGEMLFGGINGLNIFHPDSIRDDRSLPPVAVTDFQIFNKHVQIGTETNGQTVLHRSITDENEINLTYQQNVFSFEFAALHFTSPKDNLYAYMMEGFDREWNYTDANRRFVTYTNLPPGEYRFRVKASNNQGIWNEQGASVRVLISPPFWQTSWFKLLVAALLLGAIYWMYKRWIHSRELAEKSRLDEAIAKERNLLRTLIDNVPDGIYVKDLECRKTITNLADVRNIGLKSEQEVLGKNDFEIFPKELAEVFYADDQLVITTGQPVIDREEYVIHENGERRWLNTSKLPLFNKEKQIIGLIGVGRDITEKKKAEETLQRERNLLRTLIDNMPDYVYVKDTEGRFIVANSATARQLGFMAENELLGKTDFDLFPHELAEKSFADEQKILKSGKGLYEFEGPSIDPNKETKDRWISTTKVPLHDFQGKVFGTVGIGRDITERKKIEEEREILIAELQNALADVKVLKGLVPICSNCKKIRDDSGFWNQLESYIQKHSQAKFSHGICPDCMAALYPDIKLKPEKD